MLYVCVSLFFDSNSNFKKRPQKMEPIKTPDNLPKLINLIAKVFIF